MEVGLNALQENLLHVEEEQQKQGNVSLFLPCIWVHLYHFSRFHIYVAIYYICFSLSD